MNSDENAALGMALTWAHELDDDAPYDRQLIDGLYDRVGKGMIVGPSGSGKSTLAISQACDIGSGRYSNGRATLPGIAAIVAAEAPEGVRRRIKAYCRRNSVPLGAVNVAILERPLSFERNQVQILISTLRAQSREKGLPVRFVLIDTLAANEPGKEDADHFGRVIAALSLISVELDCLAVVVHHTGKSIETGARGHSSLFAAMDTVLDVYVEGKYRAGRIAKQRDGASGEAFAFGLEPVEIGFREKEDPFFTEAVTACAVQYHGVAPTRLKAPRVGHQARALDALRVDARDSARSRWAVSEACLIVRTHHEGIAGGRGTLHRNTPRKTLEALERAGHLLIEGDFITLPKT